MKTFAMAAAVAAGLLASATAVAATEAQPAAEQREAVTLRVNSASVNFADPAEVAALIVDARSSTESKSRNQVVVNVERSIAS